MSPNPLLPRQRLLPLLPGLKPNAEGWMARCPGHDDQHASLSIRETSDGTLLLKCHAGCSLDRILTPLQLQTADLFPSHFGGNQFVAAYDYRDEQGNLLFQVLRYHPKDFRQRRPDGQGGWRWRLGGCRRVLYRLPELLAASADDHVFVVEGERDADRLAGLGLVATTNPGGAGKWRSEYSANLRDRHVVILPDNDEAGRQHACRVAEALLPVAASVQVLELPGPPDKGDVSDWLAAGGGATGLQRRAATAPAAERWIASVAAEAELLQRAGNPADDALTTCLNDVAEQRVQWLWPARLPRGKLVLFDGDPGLAKSLVALDLSARITTGRPFPDGHGCPPGAVLIANAEDGTSDTIRPRLRALGANLKRVHQLRGRRVNGVEFPLVLPRDLERLRKAMQRTGAVLLVIDPVMAFLDETICSNNDQSVRQALAPLAKLAEETGCTILLIRHLNKTSGGKAIYRGGGSIGIIGACRVAFLFAPHPQGRKQRVVACIKNNLAEEPPSLAYEVVRDAEGLPQVAWLGEVELSADQLVRAPAGGDERAPNPSVLERAKRFLTEALTHGPVAVKELERLAADQEIARATLHRAREEMRLTTMRNESDQRTSSWTLHDGQPPAASELFPTAETQDQGKAPPLTVVGELALPVTPMGPYADGY